jgi:hypothetical protein
MRLLVPAWIWNLAVSFGCCTRTISTGPVSCIDKGCYARSFVLKEHRVSPSIYSGSFQAFIIMASAGRGVAKVLGINLDYRKEEIENSGAASISSVETCMQLSAKLPHLS